MLGAVSRFGLVFYSQTDSATRGIERVNQQFRSMQLSLAAMEGTASRLFGSIKTSLFGIGKTLVDSAAQVEGTKSMFMFAFKDVATGGAKQFDQAVDAGLRMVQTTEEVIQAATMMKRMGKVDIFDPRVEEQMAKVNNQGLQFIDIMGDMAAINPRGMGGVGWALSSALTGQWRSFQMRLDMSLTEVAEIKKAVAGAKTETEKLAIMTPFLFKRFGGAAISQADTWKFLASQIDDIRLKLFSTFGDPLMQALKPGLRAFNTYMTDPQTGFLSKNRAHELAGLLSLFKEVGSYLTSFVRILGTAARYIVEFVKTHPQLLKLALGLSLLVAGLAGLVAGLIAAKVAVMALAIAFGSLATPVTALVVTMAVGAVALAKWAVNGKTLADTWDKWATVLDVVVGLLSTMSDNTMKVDAGLAGVAEDKGVLSLAIKIGMWAYRVKEFFKAIWTGLTGAVGEIKRSFMPLFNQVTEIFGAFGKSATTSTDSWRDAGTTVARVLVWLIKLFAVALDWGLRFGRAVLSFGQFAWAVVSPFVAIAGYIAQAAAWLVGANGTMKTLKEGSAAVMGSLAGMALLLYGGGKVLAGVRSVTGMLGGLGGLLPGKAGKLAGAAGALGVQKVFVVNMPAGGLGGLGGAAAGAGLPGMAGKAAGWASKVPLLGAAAVAGYGMGTYIANLEDSQGRKLADNLGDWMWERFNGHVEDHMGDTGAKFGNAGSRFIVDRSAMYKGAMDAAKSPLAIAKAEAMWGSGDFAANLRRDTAAGASTWASREEARQAVPIAAPPKQELVLKTELKVDGAKLVDAIEKRLELDLARGQGPGLGWQGTILSQRK